MAIAAPGIAGPAGIAPGRAAMAGVRRCWLLTAAWLLLWTAACAAQLQSFLNLHAPSCRKAPLQAELLGASAQPPSQRSLAAPAGVLVHRWRGRAAAGAGICRRRRSGAAACAPEPALGAWALAWTPPERLGYAARPT